MKSALRLFLAAAVAVALDHLFAGLVGQSGVVLAMALAGFTGDASYDHSDDSHLDLSNEISAILLADLFLLGRIPMGGEASNIIHYWLEEGLNATYVQLNGALTTGATTVTLDSSTGCQVGALLQNETEYGKSEVMQVVSVDSATQITVVRAVGDSAPAAETHADNSRLRIIGRPKQEGDENTTNESAARSRKSNVCQIFKKEVRISGTTLAINFAGIPNEFAHQLEMRMLELKREMGMTVYSGVKIAGGSDTVYRSMDGIRNFIRNNSDQVDSTEQALSEGVVNSLYKKIYDKGGEASIAVGCAEQLTFFSSLHQDKIRLAASEKQRGVFVNKFLTEYGTELDLVIDRWGLKGDFAILDPKRLKLMPLKGRALKASPLSVDGDAQQSMIVGEYTLEFRNAGECAALATNLTAR